MVDVVNGGGVDIAVADLKRGVDGGDIGAVLCESAAVEPVLVTEFRERFAAVIGNGHVVRRGHEIIRHHNNVAADSDGVVAVDRTELFAVRVVEVGDERTHYRTADVIVHQDAIVLRRKARADGRIIVQRQITNRLHAAALVPAAEFAASSVPEVTAQIDLLHLYPCFFCRC